MSGKREQGAGDAPRPDEEPRDVARTGGDAASEQDTGAVGRQTDHLASAMQLQAEVLRRIHDQQVELGRTLSDGRRAEMMISSTRALNESFSGMRRVQERLLDRLGKDRPRRLALALAVVLGLLAVTGALVWGVGRLEETGRRLERPAKDPAAQAALAEIEGLRERLSALQGRERTGMLDRLERLHGRIESLEAERRRLKVERDEAREALGALRADRDRDAEELEQLRGRAEAAEEEVARLTTQALADQQLIERLNGLVEAFRKGASPPAEGADGGEPRPASATGEETADDDAEAGGGRPGPRLVTAAFLARLNRLLSDHRSSESYVLKTAESHDRNGLHEVVLEVRGADGSLAKTVHADHMGLTLARGGRFLELDFTGGYIDFRHGISQTLKSPFFQGRYQIVVLGVDPQAWTEARLPFLRVK